MPEMHFSVNNKIKPPKLPELNLSFDSHIDPPQAIVLTTNLPSLPFSFDAEINLPQRSSSRISDLPDIQTQNFTPPSISLPLEKDLFQQTKKDHCSDFKKFFKRPPPQ